MERLRGRGHWLGLGALAIVFLCIMLCGLGTFGMLVMRSSPAHGTLPHAQPPAGEDGAAPPSGYYAYGPLGHGRHTSWGPLGILAFGIGLIFKLLFLGLVLVLLLGMVKRLFWGRRHPCPPHWGKPAEDERSEGTSDTGWGPFAWHHRRHWGPPPAQGPEPSPTAEEGEADASESEYTGPQE
jgi:hypothetical protein